MRAVSRRINSRLAAIKGEIFLPRILASCVVRERDIARYRVSSLARFFSRGSRCEEHR